MNLRRKRSLIKLIPVGLLLIVLGAGLFFGLGFKDKVANLLSEATGKKAEIFVDAAGDLGQLPQPWRNLAQGGEEPNTIAKLTAKLQPLKPNYIRIDHIYDFYNVTDSWAGLDAEVNAILAVGAKPLLALSYLPPGLGADITAAPDNWNDWYSLVKATIEHYSGRSNKNIADVYYEVWNEPDLFGNWKTYGDKNYLQLYRISAQAAAAVTNTQPFKLGGPATTGAYPNWIEALLKLVDRENLRLDFVSWHRYSWNPEAVAADVTLINRLLEKYPRLALKEKLLTEYGPDSQNHPAYDSNLGAAHLLATIRFTLGQIHKAFIFEAMDGRDPAGQVFWGRYGLLAHHTAGLQPKPRYDLLLWLNQMEGQRLAVSGEGSWVKAIAVQNSRGLEIYLVNYDPRGSHSETVPLIVANLPPGTYQARYEWFKGRTETKTVTITAGTFTGKISLPSNGIARLTLTH